jgi:hypothetical protein
MTDRVRITVGSGDLRVIGETRDEIRVKGATASVTGDETRIEGGSDDLTVRVPLGTDVVVGSDSGDIKLEGRLGAVSVTTDSADVRAADVASIDARSRSGKLTVDRSRGPVRMKTDSARVRVRRADGAVRIATESGQVVVDEARDAVAARSVSGTITVLLAGRAGIRLETLSGAIRVSVPPGVKPAVEHRSATGKARIRVDTGDDFIIRTRTDSGDYRIRVA